MADFYNCGGFLHTLLHSHGKAGGLVAIWNSVVRIIRPSSSLKARYRGATTSQNILQTTPHITLQRPVGKEIL